MTQLESALAILGGASPRGEPEMVEPEEGHDHPDYNESRVGPGPLTTAADAVQYMLAGKATVTLRSRATGGRFTYKLTTKPPRDGRGGPVTFVGLLVGPENTGDYQYLGHIFQDRGTYWHGRKSRIAPGAPGAKAFAWAWTQLSAGRMPAQLEVWHEGSCGRCGRKLTVPESVASGFGPECITKVGGRQ